MKKKKKTWENDSYGPSEWQKKYSSARTDQLLDKTFNGDSQTLDWYLKQEDKKE